MATVEAPPADALTFGEVKISREYVIQQQGKDFVLSNGLLVGLEQLSRGYYDIDTELVQLPTPENQQTAVVRAVVVVFDPADGRTLRRSTGLGDASPNNVVRMVASHCLRMAETRALARAAHILAADGARGISRGAEGAPTPLLAPQTSLAPSWGTSGPSPAPPAPAPWSTSQAGRTLGRSQVPRSPCPAAEADAPGCS
jgi:hypothetical protein